MPRRKRETIAKKTYIRAPKYPQAAFDKALAECKADTTWQTFVNRTGMLASTGKRRD